MSLGARVGRAIFWGQAGRLAEAPLLFVFSLILARVLGPASYGLYALGMSLAGVCAFLTLLGLGPEALGRFLPEMVSRGGRNHVGRLLRKLLAVRGTAIVAFAGMVFVFRRPIGEALHFPALAGSALLVLLVFASRSILDLLTCFSSGLLELERVAAAKFAASVAAPSLFLIFCFYHYATSSAAWLAAVAGTLAGVLILALPLLATQPGLPEYTAPPLRRILAFGLFAWATNFFVFILGDSTDVLLLGWLAIDRVAIGYYAVGAKIVFSLTGLLIGWASLVNVATFSEAWQQGGLAHIETLVGAQWKLGILCLVGPYLLLIRFAREITTIIYSAAYAPSVPVIQILSGLMICNALCGFSMQGGILYALNHERLACAAVGGAAIFNIVIEVFLVRRFGIIGAAWATGLSCVLLAILCTAAGALYVPITIPVAFMVKVIAAGLLGMASTFWLHPGALWQLCAGGLLYGFVFLTRLAVMKPLSGKDSASVHHVNRFLGKWVEKLFVGVNPSTEQGRAW